MPSFDALEWARVPFDQTIYGGPGHLPRGALLTDGIGYVTVGADVTGEDWDAAVWYSADGVTRERVPHDEAVFGGSGDQAMTAVVAAGPGLVAVGFERKTAPVVVDNGGTVIDGEVYDAVVWTSVDGIAWSRVGDGDHVFSGAEEQDDQVMAAVVAAGPGLVAVGYEWDRWFRPEARFNARFGIDVSAAVWVSEDGSTWTRVPDSDGALGAMGGGSPDTPLAAYEMRSVTSWRGGLVAVGVRESGSLDLDAAVWLSDDGISWTRVSDDDATFQGRTGDLEFPDDLEMWSVAAGGPGLVAVGSERQSWAESGGVVRSDTNAAVWISADGLVWRRVPHDEGIFGGEDIQEMNTIVATPSGLVALGFDYSLAQPGGVMWVSPPPR